MFSSVRKALASAVGVALAVLAVAGDFDSFLPAGWGHAVGVLVAVLTPVATWLVPNAPAAAVKK